jgi:hypothetical protein
MQTVLFKDHTINGQLNKYDVAIKARDVFNLSPKTAHFFVVFAVRNNHLFLDELSLQQFRIARKNMAEKESHQENLEDKETAVIEHYRYLDACGLL